MPIEQKDDRLVTENVKGSERTMMMAAIVPNKQQASKN